MNGTLLSTISVMNFNNINSTRSLARKAYSPSTDFIIHNFSAARSFGEFIDYRTEQRIDDFLEDFDTTNSDLNDVSNDLKKLYTDLHKNKEVKIDRDSMTAFATENAALEQYQVAVNQLATIQIDTSKAFDKSKSELKALGTATLNIEQNDQVFTISTDTKETTNNEDVLKNVAKAVNNSEAKVKAQAQSDHQGNVRLSIESTETGENAAFETSGSFADFSALNTVSASKNAVYTINETTFQSESNTVTIDNDNVSITFLEETPQPENIEITLQADAVGTRFEKLTEKINNVTDLLADYSKDNRMLSKFERRFNYLIDTSEDTLSTIGINRNENGKFDFNQTFFNESFDENGIDHFDEISKPDGFIDQFNQFVEDFITQDVRTLIPSNPSNGLPIFAEDDFISYLSFSNRFNVEAYYPTGNILDFTI